VKARAADVARIGPNAILQLLPVLDAAIGAVPRQALFAAAGVAVPPPDAGMWPQAEVVRLHDHIARAVPDAPAVLRAAGLATADYILAHRIPAPAKWLIRSLPSALGARILARAIAQHAWTFTGTGAFRVDGFGPLTVSITANPLAISPHCDWHAAVFQRLFSALVWSDVRVTESACCGAGHAACRFTITAANRDLPDSTM
jgi:divinyl protochlorophyllide a 8-vinyl-reductase